MSNKQSQRQFGVYQWVSLQLKGEHIASTRSCLAELICITFTATDNYSYKYENRSQNTRNKSKQSTAQNRALSFTNYTFDGA
ncbi:hypothetical protein VCO01S_03500 [Vibrio comitans NBRC 102076]|uniref:Uncharacterized protein n=1 Tax=Vibrio comitans NBRC 102076 TaxID=1219078 RepID=A0A4Y3IIB3_9VIBR|nr:hypothetical protein VCO01S_03500 [Vibrio comitans NBRC 102076]